MSGNRGLSNYGSPGEWNSDGDRSIDSDGVYSKPHQANQQQQHQQRQPNTNVSQTFSANFSEHNLASSQNNLPASSKVLYSERYNQQMNPRVVNREQNFDKSNSYAQQSSASILERTNAFQYRNERSTGPARPALYPDLSKERVSMSDEGQLPTNKSGSIPTSFEHAHHASLNEVPQQTKRATNQTNQQHQPSAMSMPSNVSNTTKDHAPFKQPIGQHSEFYAASQYSNLQQASSTREVQQNRHLERQFSNELPSGHEYGHSNAMSNFENPRFPQTEPMSDGWGGREGVTGCDNLNQQQRMARNLDVPGEQGEKFGENSNKLDQYNYEQPYCQNAMSNLNLSQPSSSKMEYSEDEDENNEPQGAAGLSFSEKLQNFLNRNKAKFAVEYDETFRNNFEPNGAQQQRNYQHQQHEQVYRSPAYAMQQNRPEYNILLLGGTGVGKSTTINAFANYLSFANFSEVNSHNFVELVSSKFMLMNPSSGEDFLIQSGEDPNEYHQTGASSTQEPMAYTFLYKDKLVRIIDTPGMGDTRGLEVDKKNFDKILSYLKHYNKLHGVIILMKSNETRQVASFSYCITELLSHLHKNCSQNIMFCFTFSRNTFYGPGDGFSILKSFLREELPDMDFKPQTGVNCFYIDNEAYRYFVAKKNGFPFLPAQEKSFANSWDRSSKQTATMIGHILNLTPHDLDETFALNMARDLMTKLAQPMVQLQKNIHTNMKSIDEKLSFIQSQGQVDLQTIELDELRVKSFVRPRTVCTSKKCSTPVPYNRSIRLMYKVCCKNCPAKGVSPGTRGDKMLKSCKKFEGSLLSFGPTDCQTCGCPLASHMHITEDYVIGKKRIFDNSQLQLIEARNESIYDYVVNVMQAISKAYIDELSEIQDVAGIFGYLLEKNSNTSFNRIIEPYLDLLISEEEKKLQSVPGYPDDTHKLLTELKRQYAVNVARIKKGLGNDFLNELNLKRVNDLAKQLASLKHSGQQFRQVMETFMRMNEHNPHHKERFALNLTM